MPVNIKLALGCIVSAAMILRSILPRIDRIETPGPRLEPGSVLSNRRDLRPVTPEVTGSGTVRPRQSKALMRRDFAAFVYCGSAKREKRPALGSAQGASFQRPRNTPINSANRECSTGSIPRDADGPCAVLATPSVESLAAPSML